MRWGDDREGEGRGEIDVRCLGVWDREKEERALLTNAYRDRRGSVQVNVKWDSGCIRQ